MWFLFACPENCREILLEKWNTAATQQQAGKVFTLTCDRVRKYEGAWHLERVNLFPGYVLCDSDQPEALKQELLDLTGRLKIHTDGTTIPVSEEDRALLERLYNGRNSLEMSQGIIRDGNTFVEDGPLQGWEQDIQKIDRHKRIAFLKGSDQNSELVLKVGLEITQKTAS